MLNNKVFTITPSWVIGKRKDFADGVATLKRLGFHVLNDAFVTRLPSVRRKVQQIHRAFTDTRADIIIAQRGGYSSMKLLPYLDFALIRKNPKIFAGFSDLSTMLNVLNERCGLVTLHAPMLINFSAPTRFTVNSFLNAVRGFPNKNLFDGAPVNVYSHGNARGTLRGGNLITLTALIGTPWDVSMDNAIVFLEDVDEKLHEVDRYLTQWILAGKLKKIKGLILGNFRGIRPPGVYKIITSQIKLSCPVIHCPYIGHVKNKITLPVGASVELNTRTRELTVL